MGSVASKELFRDLTMADVMLEFHDGPHATPPPADEGPTYLGIKNMSETGSLDLLTIRHVSVADFPQWTKRVTPQAGDLVFTYEASLHRYALIPREFEGCLGRRVALVRPRRDVVDPKFLLLYMLGPEWRETVEDRVITGATVDRIPLVDFPTFPIRLPPLSLQRRIAGVLGAFDTLIEINERRMGLLEDLARSLYREWFVHFRFPGDGTGRFVDSEHGQIPDGWTPIVASGIFDFNPRVGGRAGSFPKVTMGDVSTRFSHVLPSASSNRPSGPRYRHGDVLMARITPSLENGKTALALFLGPEEVGIGSTELIVLRGRDVGPAFTYCAARSQPFRDHAIKSMSGASGRQRVASDCFDSLPMVRPTEEVAALFESDAMPMLEEVFQLRLQNDQLAKARDLLLPRLVTGQLDISDIDLGVLTPAESD
jgi:type I restriction enzyme S subunit